MEEETPIAVNGYSALKTVFSNPVIKLILTSLGLSTVFLYGTMQQLGLEFLTLMDPTTISFQILFLVTLATLMVRIAYGAISSAIKFSMFVALTLVRFLNRNSTTKHPFVVRFREFLQRISRAMSVSFWFIACLISISVGAYYVFRVNHILTTNAADAEEFRRFTYDPSASSESVFIAVLSLCGLLFALSKALASMESKKVHWISIQQIYSASMVVFRVSLVIGALALGQTLAGVQLQYSRAVTFELADGRFERGKILFSARGGVLAHWFSRDSSVFVSNQQLVAIHQGTEFSLFETEMN